jgi:hypothetical protein
LARRLRLGLRLALIGGLAGLALVAAIRLLPDAALPVPPSALEQECHASAYAAFEESVDGGETRRVVPGDRNALLPGVDVEVTTSSGSASAGTLVRLRDARGELSVEVGFDTSFERLLTLHPVPEELRGPAGESLRRVVEEAAFDRVCARADPSLEWLLRPDKSLRWLRGEPALPESYALFVDPPAPAEPYWIEYLGANHRRLTEDTFGDRLEVIDRRGKLELSRSGHGAVVRDLERQVYAWVYVFPGGRKLRWPSVIGGKLEDGAVLLQIDHPVIGVAGEQVRIDLESGMVSQAGWYAPDSHGHLEQLALGRLLEGDLLP